MPDTPRARDPLAAVLADNSTGDLSAQDLRDLLAYFYLRSDVQTQVGAETFIVEFATPSTIWTIAHGLGRHPHVVALDSDAREILGGVKYDGSHKLFACWKRSQSGRAILR